MIYRSLLKDDNEASGIIGFIIPISAMFGLVLIFHMLAKVGVGIPPVLLEPVFDLWLVFVGILLAVCIFMRQFFVLFLCVMISFVVTVAIYIMYVI